MAVLRLFRWLLLSVALIGCRSTINDCDEDSLMRFAVDPEGRISFAGQALVHTGCAAGRCHDEGAEGRDRYGVPLGLDFGLPIAVIEDVREPLPEGHQAMLTRSRENILRHAEAMLTLIDRGAMPPGADPDENLAQGGYRHLEYRLGQCHFGDALPSIQTEEGRELVRNWLACGAPIVEATDPTLPNISGDRGVHRSPLCEEERAPGLMTFERLYAEVFQPSCALAGCHDAASPDLRMDSLKLAYSELFARAPGDTAHCETESAREALPTDFIVPGDPDASYLLHKMTDPLIPAAERPICGDPMPRNGRLPRAIEKVRAWIEAGAPGPVAQN